MAQVSGPVRAQSFMQFKDMDGLPLAARILALRQWENEHLPIGGTLLGYDLLVFIAREMAEGRPGFSLSKVYSELNYSEAAIRLHLGRLERDGFVARRRDEGDRRNRLLYVTEKFRTLWSDYESARHAYTAPGIAAG
jgi:DNA-binding MarR family transcriptional regulator